ncbi:HPP family protein [Seohaeicola zhoushanensis]|nr:HPP family protein [Seohaeicola zhoushanensis]
MKKSRCSIRQACTTAVLAFEVLNAPLTQPWSAMLGNSLSARVAVLMLSIYPRDWAPALRVGLAIAAMMAAGALHPPSGAEALLATLNPGPGGGPDFLRWRRSG